MSYIKTVTKNGFSFRVMNVNGGIIWPNYSSERTMRALENGDPSMIEAFSSLTNRRKEISDLMTEHENRKEWEKHYREAEKSKSENKMDPGWIYLIKSESGYYKIGLTRKSVRQRVSQLSKATALDLSLLHSVKSKFVGKDEKFLHKMFRHRKHKREWFDLKEEEVEYIKSNEWISP